MLRQFVVAYQQSQRRLLDGVEYPESRQREHQVQRQEEDAGRQCIRHRQAATAEDDARSRVGGVGGHDSIKLLEYPHPLAAALPIMSPEEAATNVARKKKRSDVEPESLPTIISLLVRPQGHSSLWRWTDERRPDHA